MRRTDDRMASLAQLSQAILERLDTPLRAPEVRDEQLAALAEMAPLTLRRPAGGEEDDVRRDLGAEMASAARRDTGHLRHDARPPALDPSRAARESFPQAYASLAFLGGGAPLTVAAASAAGGQRVAGRGEGTQGGQDNRWSILSRPPVTGPSQSTAPSGALRLYDPDIDGTGFQVRASNNFDPAAAAAGRPTRAGMIAALGYGPESIDQSEGVRSVRPTSGLRQPAEGVSLSLTEKDVEEFTGVLVVRQAADGGGIVLDGDPTEWLTKVYDKLRERRISPARWVLALAARLSKAVRHAFRFHFGPIFERRGRALVETVFPFTTPADEHDLFESVSFEDFWTWLLRHYLRPAHLNAARSMWQAMGDKKSSIATLADDTFEFTRLLLRADLMEAVISGDEGAMRDPALRDTVERREIYRRMLPEEVRRHVTQTESIRLLSADDTLGLSGVAASMDASRIPPAALGELTLAQLQRAASKSAEILHREMTRDGARLNSLHLGGELDAARLTALEATVQGIALEAELQAEQPAPDELTLFNVIATHMPDAPPPHVIQQRREAKQCLACGESSAHWRFQDCPRVKAQPQLMQVLREWMRRDRATRGRGTDGAGAERVDNNRAAGGPPRAERVGDNRRFPAARPTLREHLNTAITALQSVAASLSPRSEGQEDSDGEAAGDHPRRS